MEEAQLGHHGEGAGPQGDTAAAEEGTNGGRGGRKCEGGRKGGGMREGWRGSFKIMRRKREEGMEVKGGVACVRG